MAFKLRHEVTCDTCKTESQDVWAFDEAHANIALQKLNWEAHDDTHVCPNCRNKGETL